MSPISEKSTFAEKAHNELKVFYEDINPSSEILSNSMRGEWVEFAKNNTYSITLRFFWKGSGYMAQHVHMEYDEAFEVIKGEATYYIKGRRYHAKEGQIIKIRAGQKHINPFNTKNTPLVLIANHANNEMMEFYSEYYKMIENESFVSKPRSLPTWIQYLALNKHFHFQTRFLVAPMWKEKLMYLWMGKNYDKYLAK
jgi:mannose-6-phosphate isomerase-like protein (cupin superfamily)